MSARKGRVVTGAAGGGASPRLRRLALRAALAALSAASAAAGFSVGSLASWALLALSVACACACAAARPVCGWLELKASARRAVSLLEDGGDPAACHGEASRALSDARPWLLRTGPAALAGWAAGAACAALGRKEEAASWRAWLSGGPFRGAAARAASAAAASLEGAAPGRPPAAPALPRGPEPSLALRVALRALLGAAAWAACVFAVSGVLFFSTSHPITDVPVSKGVRYGVRIGGGDEAPSADGRARRVASPDDAPVGEDEDRFVSEPLLELESDDALARVFFISDRSKPDGNPRFYVQRFGKEGGGYIEDPPGSGWSLAFVDPDDLLEDFVRHTYSQEEAAADNLVHCFFSGTSLDPPSLFPFFGASDDPAVKELSILGRPPDGVVEYEHEGKAYYFWYYDGSFDFGRHLVDEGFDFGDFTIGRLVEALEIEVPE
ncbi:hypothetical protein B5F40_03715 [Gordonibacter sp. An230]|uniref:hypothetical protein n=1 Tax=Gordonibacter sp. An230 TaxID=1965592 RepID=UPI000B38E69E|nr:hypothetical protein [Gordonibacter sp. An230]OUO91549.1 hypothetical protein B5F40_03715 [Gordonibacter sp. An230]